MAETLGDIPDTGRLDDGEPAADRRRSAVPRVVGALVLAGLAGLWLSRDGIVDTMVSWQLRQLGLRGTYQVASAGTAQQVLTHVVIGDPAHPDLTIDRVEFSLSPRFGLPAIGAVRLVRPRIYGTYYHGKLSFGALDKVLFGAASKEPFRLPDMNLTIADGQGRLAGDFGMVALQLAGKGNLIHGFSGTLAAQAPGLAIGGCTTGPVTLNGTVSVDKARPRLQGPLRLALLDCPQRGLHLRQAQVQVDGLLDETLDGGGARLRLTSGALAYSQARIRALDGWVQLDAGHGALMANYAVTARGAVLPQVRVGTLTLSGAVRGQQGAQHFESEGKLTGSDIRPGAMLGSGLDSAQAAVGNHLVAPLLAQFRGALARQGAGSRLAADYVLRRDGPATSVIVPQARVTGGQGDNVLTLSQIRWDGGDATPPRIAGQFAIAGAGMPHIAGVLTPGAKGATLIRLAMADYQAGSSHLAIPRLDLIRAADGGIALSGQALASGTIPGGRINGFALPLDGGWKPGRGLWMWRRCQDFRFASMAYGDLALDSNRLTLCPGPGGAILRPGRKGTIISARAPSLALTGALNGTRLRLTSGPLAFAGAGQLTARNLAAAFGGKEDQTRLVFADFSAHFAKDIGGAFAGGEGKIHGVPLSLRDANGEWHWASGKLTISGHSLRLLDQAAVARFEPLHARDVTIAMVNKQLAAEAILREPKSDREIVDLRLAHDFYGGGGHAIATLPGVSFDSALQPDMLSALAKGVIANASGTVSGEGRIDWTPDNVTSSGRISTPGLDFAAAFGPAQGVAGTVVFSDLLGLVTEPDQRLTIAAINPGIEVNNGLLSFALLPDHVLTINGATWPFLDGRMTLQPTQINLAQPEVRRYVLDVQGVSAARFVEKLDMGNLAASGLFDGSLPLAFYPDGGKIEGGMLVSRPPGGNVSYIGALTYKDLSPIANFAFNTLRSLDYRRMAIMLDGDLSGEIVTRVRFDGVRQGKGAKRTFITRQLSRLPIQMNIKVRAPFFALISNFKRMYDPSYYSAQIVSRLMDQVKPPAGTAPATPAAVQQDVQPSVIGKRP